MFSEPFRDCLGAKPYQAADADRRQLSFFDALVEHLARAVQNQCQLLYGHGTFTPLYLLDDSHTSFKYWISCSVFVLYYGAVELHQQGHITSLYGQMFPMVLKLDATDDGHLSGFVN